MLRRITIVGRPNVGKSSLFNVLTGHKIAIVSDIENTTRDIVEFVCQDEEAGISYIVADSGGIVSGSQDAVLEDVRLRVIESIDRSDIILFVIDFAAISSVDDEIANMLRKSGKRVILIANKADNGKRAIESFEHLRFGFSDIVPTSAVHARGITELQHTISRILKDEQGYSYYEPSYGEDTLKIAIIGRPNVGKSSLVNAITGETKAMVRDMPGTTRDAVDTPFTYKDQKFVLIDTAGIRRSGKIGTGNIEDWSVVRSQRAIERADIVALVIDAFDGISAQDLHILERALEENKGIILVANKWDKVLAKPGIDKITIMDRYIDYLREKVDFASFVIPVFTSATDGKRVEEILERAQFIFAERHKRIKTSVFNTFLAQILLDHPPTGNKKSHNPKIQYGSQVDTNPPKFVFFVNNPGHFHFSYARYIENRIRETFGFDGTPMVIEYKGKENPYYTKKSPQNKTFEGNKRKR